MATSAVPFGHDPMQWMMSPSYAYLTQASTTTNTTKRKFQIKDEVIVKNPKNPHVGQQGKISSYDVNSYKYQVKLNGRGNVVSFSAKDLAAMAALKVGDVVIVPKNSQTDGTPFPDNKEFVKGSIVDIFNGWITVQVDEDQVNNTWGTAWVSASGKLQRCWSFQPQYVILASSVLPPKKIIDFDTVVIADEKRRQILEALEQIHQADLIFNVWGFGATMEKGKGVSMLFYGPPGTGKTLMAQAISEKLQCQLKIINTADIESSEPGAAERNIRDIFKNASGKKTVLLFDECDSLVFDRSLLGPILGAQVNELLSSLEKYDGVTIFTTNRVETLDEAVNRRLALKLEFEMPNQEQREQIWRRMFPPECPLGEDVNFTKLSQVEIAGGHIKNAVLRSARIAALVDKPNADKKIHMAHLVRALTEEGKSMLAFHEAKKKFNVAGWGGVGGARHSASNTIEMDKMSDVVARMGDAYE